MALLVSLVAAPASSVVALAAMVGVYAAGFVVGAVVTRGVQHVCRELRCSTVRYGETSETYGDAEGVEMCLAALLALERARAVGRIDEVGFELGWGRIYEETDARSREFG